MLNGAPDDNASEVGGTLIPNAVTSMGPAPAHYGDI